MGTKNKGQGNFWIPLDIVRILDAMGNRKKILTGCGMLKLKQP